jgi:mRNA interferase YafQ
VLRLSKSTRFKKDLKRILKDQNKDKSIEALSRVIDLLQNQVNLPEKYQVHRLKGKYSGHFECHVRPDLLLIYSIVNDSILELVRLGSHSELFK